MVTLSINGILKTSNNLTYDDLVILCDEYYLLHKKAPNNKDFNSKNNLPSIRCVRRILADNNVTKNDFLSKYSYNRHYTCQKEIDNYQYYVDKFIDISKKLNKPIECKKLKDYELPGVEWFVKYCPDQNVKKWNDFVIWCGLIPTNKMPVELIESIIIDLDKKLDRPLVKRDFVKHKIGVSYKQVIDIWGSLNNCKRILGLKFIPQNNKKEKFDYYKSKLDTVLDKISDKKTFITWSDILHNNGESFDYYDINYAFEDYGVNIIDYISEKGFSFWRSGENNFSYYHFDTGESVSSSYEYDVTTFLNNCCLYYGRDYERNVLYKNILNTSLNSKINCDYLLFNHLCIEVAGFLDNDCGNWDNIEHSQKILKDYQYKLKQKKKLLEDNNIPYLFLFSSDFNNDNYKTKIILFIFDNLHNYIM